MKPVEYFEEFYKQGLLSTASVPRVILLLYDRLSLLLQQALELQARDLPLSHRYAVQAQSLLGELLNIFLQSKEEAYAQLYTSHAEIERRLVASLDSRFDSAEVQTLYQLLERYRTAWRSQLQIRPRQPLAPQAETESEARRTQLNIRPHSDPT